MKPIRIFIFYATVMLLLFVMALLYPKQGIGIGGDLRLKFMDVSNFVHKDSPASEVDVQKLLAGSMVTADPETDPQMNLFLPSDDITLSAKPVVVPANADRLKLSVYRIQFSEGDSSLLEGFFKKLNALKSGKLQTSRILHFGDSQIENDRMTSLIRYRFQKQVGGGGTGLIQAVPLYSANRAYKQDEKGDWSRYTFFRNRDTTIAHNSFGIMGAYTSVPLARNGDWPMLHYRFNTSRKSGQCDQVRLFLHSYADVGTLVFQVNDTLTDTLNNITRGFNEVSMNQHVLVEDLKIFMNLPEGGRLYGISFESSNGLQVDNIPMRGSSGLIFSKMNREQQEDMLACLSPGLILLQYGGNVVPYMNPTYYKEAFKNELEYFKEICPETPIVVIGPADMSVRRDGEFITYPSLESIRDALKEAALESGFAFWDLYNAMGGYNSMPSFVAAQPPLATSDYIHFTPLGANLVAEMFYNALMLEYNNFAKQNNHL